MESVGECPELIMELWTNLEIASKYVGERLKIEILLDLLADYDTTKAVSGGDYPSVCALWPRSARYRPSRLRWRSTRARADVPHFHGRESRQSRLHSEISQTYPESNRERPPFVLLAPS
jgi:hypothetical protein